MTDDEFWARVTKTPFGCWTWKGKTHPDGPYGRLRIHGEMHYAHRVAYEIAYGEIPTGMQVLHDCDNPPCVNPRHLFLGTHADNMADKAAKGRAHVGKLTAQNARDIVALRSSGLRVSEIAAVFGVSVRTVYHVLEGHTWWTFSGIRHAPSRPQRRAA